MSGRFRTRGVLLLSCLAAVVGATAPGTAYAAEKENLPPVATELQTGSRDCATGDTPAYVDSLPTLSARLTDPVEDDPIGEPELLTAEFELWWTDATGTEQRRTVTSRPAYPDRIHRVTAPSDTPADTVISWHVRADDGRTRGSWSPEAPGAACRFVRDDRSPEAPVVNSPEYPAEVRGSGGVGVYGSFTMDSPSADVVEYQYSFNGGPYAAVRPAEPGGPATVRYVPTSNAPQTLSVQAVDRAGRTSPRTDHTFYPKAASAPVSRWKLADAAGSTTATPESGQPARAGRGVAFGGPVPSGTALTSTATFDGTGHGFLTTPAPAVDSGRTFAVGAWVRPAGTGSSMTVVSQDTGIGTAYSLGLRAAAGKPAAWSFTLGGATVSGGAPGAGEWAYLLGVYDTETGYAQLFVDGREVGTKAKAAPVAADGGFQIGRVRGKLGYRDRWQGEIGDVRAYDRLVVPQEVTGLAKRQAKPLGHWSFSTATDGVTPGDSGGAPMRLGAGASINRGPERGGCIPDLDPDCPFVPYPLVGEGSLVLDGVTGHAALDGPLVDTGDSFTLGVVAKIENEDATRPMTVLSQAGAHTDAFKLRYDPALYAWQLVMPERDEAGAPEVVVSQVSAPGGRGSGTQLAIVYDDRDNTVKLYVDGYTNADATAQLPHGWPSTGAFQVGRARTADGWGEYLKGTVDEVQAFAGVLSEREIPLLGAETDPCLCF
ncbi:LamG-like jellyroll fold domain-containing protein [Streptomyces sp. NPDC090025]|uniref:LamG-like jellyroll fold domain-containing protein n=1 Tax=Streptomyces sp. NPDC090025 TaxID=3365922 RepID=UPI00383347D1